ncbi:MAG: cysteine desulfurase, partial [Planctomycetes bacterium]|nr:cysteine desulfurase [Planctomycetota bacterium]
MTVIYLDYNATTPLDGTVVEAMMPYLTKHHGNPSSGHERGAIVKEAVIKARQQVATLLGASSEEVVFTSSGSESNNQVLKGVAHTRRADGDHIITSTIEHPAILMPCAFLEQNGFRITRVPVDGTGMVDPDDVRKAITPRTILISIMHANNEVGTIQPIAEMAKIARQAGVWFHTDAAQTTGKIRTKVDELGVDFLTVAGHKLYAPQGIGALYIRSGIEIEPLIHGAGHEG